MWCHRQWVCTIAQRSGLLFERNNLDKFGGGTTYLRGLGETSRMKTHSQPLKRHTELPEAGRRYIPRPRKYVSFVDQFMVQNLTRVRRIKAASR